jgi:RNA polymerase sigma factor (sigma-70 family)
MVPVNLPGKGHAFCPGADTPSGRDEHDPLILGKAIDDLPNIERLVLSLHYCEGLNLEEVGMVLNLKESKVDSIYRQALGNLRKRYPLS